MRISTDFVSNRESFFEIDIDTKKCIGCGFCSEISLGFFEIRDNMTAVINEKKINESIKSDLADNKLQILEFIKSSADSCPVAAIKVIGLNDILSAFNL